jgi:DNA-binding transcriptional MerR regulator
MDNAPDAPSPAQEPAATQPHPRPVFRIGDVCRLTGLKPFVVRYWETEFPMLRPEKTPSGHRLYRTEDVELILEIKRLLYEEGFTIAGARRWLEQRAGETARAGERPAPASLERRLLLDLHEQLRAVLTLLESEC